MPSRSLMRSFLLLWMVTGAVLLVGSVRTVVEGAGSHPNPHLVLLGGVEALAALLFVVPRTMRLGAIGLLVTIGIAFVVHTVMGQFRGDLLLYAATVVFVSVHGPLTGSQWRALV